MVETKIHIGKEPYPLFIEKGLINNIDILLHSYVKNRSIFLLTDENVYKYYGVKVIGKLRNEKSKFNYYMVPAGEESKSIENYKKIISKLTEDKFDRSSILIALGGGMIGDLGGFVASTYMRGIDIIHIPTTLLAHVDSCIGGKTAINFEGFKNLLGTFYHPVAIAIDTNTLETLPNREYIAALGEIIKYGMLADYDLLVDLNKNYEDYLSRKIDLDKIILKCIKIKEEIVIQDEKDFGIRQMLNLGHTFAHGIESATSLNQFLHGEAVALGLHCATTLSWKLNLITKDYCNLIKNIIHKYFSNIFRYDLDPEEIVKYMVMDKKNKYNSLIFILPTGQEKASMFEDIPLEIVKKSIMEAKYGFSYK